MGKTMVCGVCGNGASLHRMLDMGSQPLAEKLDDDTTYPLALLRCDMCGLVQLDHSVDQALLFPLNHPYATGNTRALREHYLQLARELSWKTSPCKGRLAVDIGANDGTFLQELQNQAGYDGLAVEPTNQARKARDKRISTIQAFWTRELAQKILADKGPAKLITAMNVLAHVPKPHDFMAGVTGLLADDGTFVTENHDLASITEGLQIDTVYHEHQRYYSVASLSYLLAHHGMQVMSVEPISTHGGSLRVTARKETPDLETRAVRAVSTLNTLLRDATADGAKVYGVAATTRATPLIHFAKIAPYVTMICETPSSQKIGHKLPGTTIPIVDEIQLIRDQPGYALLLAWHIAGDLIARLKSQGYKGRFIVPLPEPVIIDG